MDVGFQNPSAIACHSCPIHNDAPLKARDINMDEWKYMVALVGNPNTGKRTVFNALTGQRQHTGNWPGMTVTSAEGSLDNKEKLFTLVDLPSSYSLLATSLEEEIARAFPGLPNACWLALRLLEGDQRVADAVRKGELTNRIHMIPHQDNNRSSETTI
jgi:ferrous iron transport protein B